VSLYISSQANSCQERFSNLKFNYIELETRQGFLENLSNENWRDHISGNVTQELSMFNFPVETKTHIVFFRAKHFGKQRKDQAKKKRIKFIEGKCTVFGGRIVF
jgi:hypothetical protein